MRRAWRWYRGWRHRHGMHSLCREIEVQVVDHYSFDEQWLVDEKGEKKLEITTFGGWPVYRTEIQHD